MKPILKMEEHSVHLWQAFLPDLLVQLDDFSLLLNENEMERANRFHFEQHRSRFIIARAVLRHILSLYTDILPADIRFDLGPRGKPYLNQNKLDLQFNISHSHDMAVYAITKQAEIGIDIEKIEPNFNEDVAKRFFSAKEYAELLDLPESERINKFYSLWAGKEAIIKALGEGLYAPLADFSLDLFTNVQTVEIIHHRKMYQYHLQKFSVQAEYASAFATSQNINNIFYWQWGQEGLESRRY